MHYSLNHRFRATFVGTLLGEIIAQNTYKQSPIDSEVGKIAVLGAKSLIELGKLDVDNWLERYHQKSPHLDITNQASPAAIIATLPVALFFHENTSKLRQNLLHILQIWHDDPLVRDGALAVGYAIAQSLTEKLHPPTLIPEIIAFIGETLTPLAQKLLKVHELLHRGAGLATAQAEFCREAEPSNVIAMAFYCFLSTREDFRLAVLRANHKDNFGRQTTRTVHDSQMISAITGALSGADNSTAGIPVKWRILLSPKNLATWELASFSQMLELSDALVAVWSGVYDIALHTREFPEEGCVKSDEKSGLCVFAAPHVIRLR
jgi:ADP-ribosylglycohydrolase